MKNLAASVRLLLLATLAGVPGVARADDPLSPARDLESKTATLGRLVERHRQYDDARQEAAPRPLRELQERARDYARASESGPRDPRLIGATYAELERAFATVAASTEDLRGGRWVRQAWEDVQGAMARVQEEAARQERTDGWHGRSDRRDERAERRHEAWRDPQRPSRLVLAKGAEIRLVVAKPLCADQLPAAGTDVWLKLDHDLFAGETRIVERGGLAAVRTAAEGGRGGQSRTLTLKINALKIGDNWTEVHSSPVTLVARGREIAEPGTYRGGPRPGLRGDVICIPEGAIYEFHLDQEFVIGDGVDGARER